MQDGPATAARSSNRVAPSERQRQSERGRQWRATGKYVDPSRFKLLKSASSHSGVCWCIGRRDTEAPPGTQVSRHGATSIRIMRMIFCVTSIFCICICICISAHACKCFTARAETSRRYSLHVRSVVPTDSTFVERLQHLEHRVMLLRSRNRALPSNLNNWTMPQAYFEFVLVLVCEFLSALKR